MKNIIKLLVILSVLGCNTNEDLKNEDIVNLEGKWTLIRFKNDVYHQYLEVEFIKESKMQVFSEDDVSLGQMDYSINADKISFNNEVFTIIKSLGKMEFSGNENKYILYRVPFNLDKISRDQINPIYFRKNYFLIHTGVIKIDEAIDELKSIEVIDPNDILKEEIPINN